MNHRSVVKIIYAVLLGLGVAAGLLQLPYVLTSVLGVVALAAFACLILSRMLKGQPFWEVVGVLRNLLQGRTTMSNAENVAALRQLVLASAFLPFAGHVIAQIVADAQGWNATPINPRMIAAVGLLAFLLSCAIKLQRRYWDAFDPWMRPSKLRVPWRMRLANLRWRVVSRFRKPLMPPALTPHAHDWVNGRSPTLEQLSREPNGGAFVAEERSPEGTGRRVAVTEAPPPEAGPEGR